MSFSAKKSMDHLPRKAISSVPKLASRTPFAFVVDSLLVRAADDAVRHNHRQRSMLLDKFQYLPGDDGIVTDVATIHRPVVHLSHVGVLRRHDADSDFRRFAQVGAVERNRRNWPAAHSLPRFLAQALEEPIFRHVTMDPFDPPGCRESSPWRTQLPGLRAAC